jgi:hypothetical protein
MSVDNQHSTPVGGAVEEIRGYFDTSEKALNQFSVRLVVISRQKNDVRALSPPSGDFAANRGLRRAPVPRRTEVPTVDDVADEEELVGRVMPQKIQQFLGFASARTKMQVGDPNRSVAVTSCAPERFSGTEKIRPVRPASINQWAFISHSRTPRRLLGNQNGISSHGLLNHRKWKEILHSVEQL